MENVSRLDCPTCHRLRCDCGLVYWLPRVARPFTPAEVADILAACNLVERDAEQGDR